MGRMLIGRSGQHAGSAEVKCTVYPNGKHSALQGAFMSMNTLRTSNDHTTIEDIEAGGAECGVYVRGARVATLVDGRAYKRREFENGWLEHLPVHRTSKMVRIASSADAARIRRAQTALKAAQDRLAAAYETAWKNGEPMNDQQSIRQQFRNVDGFTMDVKEF